MRPLRQLLLLLLVLLAGIWLIWPTAHAPSGLVIHVAASLRRPIQTICDAFTAQTGIACELRFGGSQMLLSQIEQTGQGDIFLPADDSYLQLPSAVPLIRERIPITQMRAVVAVRADAGNVPRQWSELVAAPRRLALAEPKLAAIGKRTQDELTRSGHWPALAKRLVITTPTVLDSATAIELGTVDAGIVWDAVVRQLPTLTAIELPELAPISAQVDVAVLQTTTQPESATRLAQWIATAPAARSIWTAAGFPLREMPQP
ncbi:molybdate ABC transporter substrate-binding protein [Tuwongella immobilis]|nr:molybdate ABC transporter substrate-binding protein [Tuwongella immobilis]